MYSAAENGYGAKCSLSYQDFKVYLDAYHCTKLCTAELGVCASQGNDLEIRLQKEEEEALGHDPKGDDTTDEVGRKQTMFASQPPPKSLLHQPLIKHHTWFLNLSKHMAPKPLLSYGAKILHLAFF